LSNIILINFNLDSFHPLIHVWHRLENGGMAMIKNLELMLAEVGKIKIGTKGKIRQGKNGEWRQPEKLDHFLITTVERDSGGLLIPDKQVMDKYPENPKEIDIMFLFDEIEKNFQSSYALFAGSTCRCRGDGEKAVRLNKDGSTSEIACNPQTCPFYSDPASKAKCKMNGVLSCLLSKSTRLGGIYKFRTTGFHSVRNITSSLGFIRQLTGGRLAGIPFKLTMGGKNSQVAGRGTFYAVNVEYHGTPNEMLECVMGVAKNRALLKHDMKVIGFNEIKIDEALTSEEMKDIMEEFYPENQPTYPHAEKQTVEVSGSKVEVTNNSQKLTLKEPEAEDVPDSEVKNINAELIAKCIVLERKTGVTKEQLIAKRTAMIGTSKIHGCSSPISLASYHSSLEAELELKAETDNAKSIAKKELESLRTSIQDIYTSNKVSTEQQRQFNYETLKTAELSSSRTKVKLETLLELVKMNYDVGDIPAEDDEGDL